MKGLVTKLQSLLRITNKYMKINATVTSPVFVIVSFVMFMIFVPHSFWLFKKKQNTGEPVLALLAATSE